MHKIGLFGGSFNPIHNAHIALASTIRNIMALDEVWFLVSPQNPLKKATDLLDENTRYELTALALEGEEGLKASNYEFHLPRPSYTWNTLQHLTADYPDCTFYLVIGGDNWNKFSKWAHHEEIIANHHIIVYPRPGCKIDTESLPSTVHVVDTPLMDISSTMIRERIRCGEDISEYVPYAVAAYIEQHPTLFCI